MSILKTLAPLKNFCQLLCLTDHFFKFYSELFLSMNATPVCLSTEGFFFFLNWHSSSGCRFVGCSLFPAPYFWVSHGDTMFKHETKQVLLQAPTETVGLRSSCTVTNFDWLGEMHVWVGSAHLWPWLLTSDQCSEGWTCQLLHNLIVTTHSRWTSDDSWPWLVLSSVSDKVEHTWKVTFLLTLTMMGSLVPTHWLFH